MSICRHIYSSISKRPHTTIHHIHRPVDAALLLLYSAAALLLLYHHYTSTIRIPPFKSLCIHHALLSSSTAGEVASASAQGQKQGEVLAARARGAGEEEEEERARRGRMFSDVKAYIERFLVDCSRSPLEFRCCSDLSCC